MFNQILFDNKATSNSSSNGSNQHSPTGALRHLLAFSDILLKASVQLRSASKRDDEMEVRMQAGGAFLARDRSCIKTDEY